MSYADVRTTDRSSENRSSECDKWEGFTGGQRVHGNSVVCANCDWSPSQNGFRRTPQWCIACNGTVWTMK